MIRSCTALTTAETLLCDGSTAVFQNEMEYVRVDPKTLNQEAARIAGHLIFQLCSNVPKRVARLAMARPSSMTGSFKLVGNGKLILHIETKIHFSFFLNELFSNSHAPSSALHKIVFIDNEIASVR